MNDKTKSLPCLERAEQLVKVYISNAEELPHSGFSTLYFAACERDEAAAEALRLDCEAAGIVPKAKELELKLMAEDGQRGRPNPADVLTLPEEIAT